MKLREEISKLEVHDGDVLVFKSPEVRKISDSTVRDLFGNKDVKIVYLQPSEELYHLRVGNLGRVLWASFKGLFRW